MHSVTTEAYTVAIWLKDWLVAEQPVPGMFSRLLTHLPLVIQPQKRCDPSLKPFESVSEGDLSGRKTSQQEDKLVSTFLLSIIEFWDLILRQPPIPLKLGPDNAASGERVGVSRTTPDTEAGSDVLDSDAAENVTIASKGDETSDGLPNTSTDSPSKRAEDASESNGPSRFTQAELLECAQCPIPLASLFLREQLDNLREWKARFADEDLDRLAQDPSAIGRSVLECLVNIAKALICECYETRRESHNLCNIETKIQGLTGRVKELIRESEDKDTVMTDDVDCTDDDASAWTDTTAGEGGTLLMKLTDEIKRLKWLSSLARAEFAEIGSYQRNSTRVGRWVTENGTGNLAESIDAIRCAEYFCRRNLDVTRTTENSDTVNWDLQAQLLKFTGPKMH
ncbi:hypothetical protein NM208_g9806 [Fusarium decemcellulare]|uniref:Uncharacterized protein n=1 Tax=Fusarium decemcellulare TaxID=57161 RepID=A0ACC1S0B8_9HYPO|nr:hypothetical protein NM208_g9806 [Fusarium decemcellulare]